MTLKIYWYETGVLSTAKSAAANQARANARQGSGKSAEQNRKEFVDRTYIGREHTFLPESRTQQQRDEQLKQLNEQARDRQQGMPQGVPQEAIQQGQLYKRKISDSVGVSSGVGQEQRQVSSSNQAFDEGGTVTLTEKKYFPRESRQEIKDFLKQNKAESYKIYNEQGKLLVTTSGRRAYPDILRASLAGPVSVRPYSELPKGQQYVALGVGNIFTIPQPTKAGYKTYPAYGPQPKPQSQNIPRQDRTISGAFVEAGKLFTRPYTNIYEDISGFATGKESKAVPTTLDKMIQAGEQTLTPGARELFATKGIIRKATPEEKQRATTAFPEFIKQTERQLKQDSKQVILPLLGETSFFITPLPIAKGAGAVFNVAKQNKYLVQVAKDFREVLAPKGLGLAKLKEKIPASPATGLSKAIGGETLIPSRVSIKSLGGDIVRLESESIQQGKAIFYDVKLKKAFAVEGITEKNISEIPDAFKIRGSLADDVKLQTKQQKYYDITQIEKDLFATAGKSSPRLIKAFESESIARIGSVKTFSLEQIKKQPKEFGRYFFGREPEPTKPLSYFGLAETRGYLTGGTKIKSSKLRNIFDIDVFKPFKESKVKLTTRIKSSEGSWSDYIFGIRKTEKFTKKLPTSSYVTDVQKNIRFVDPFSKSGRSFFGTKINKAMLGATDEGFGKYPTGKKSKTILTQTKAERDLFTKTLKEEKSDMDILFKGPRFENYYGPGASGLAAGGRLQYDYSSEFENPNIPPSLRMVESPQAVRYENEFDLYSKKSVKIKKDKYRDEYGFLPISDITPKETTRKDTTSKLITDVIPKYTPYVVPTISLKIIPKTTPLITPKTTPKLVPDLTQELVPELVPDFPIFRPPPPEEVFGKPGGFPFNVPRLYLGSYGFDDAKGTKKIYNAYGISEDINVKQLAKFSYFGSPKIFKQLEAADRKSVV